MNDKMLFIADLQALIAKYRVKLKADDMVQALAAAAVQTAKGNGIQYFSVMYIIQQTFMNERPRSGD